MNNLLQLATHFSSEVFIKSGGFSKFNNKFGAKTPITLKVSGISLFIAMGITIWPFRANFSRTEVLHDIIKKAKAVHLCPSKQSSFTLPCTLHAHPGGVVQILSCIGVWYIFTGQKCWLNYLGFNFSHGRFRCVLHCATATQHTVCECCTWIILPALQETCQGNQVGDFQKEQQHLSVCQALAE